jgi:hypothetical protein
MEPISTLYTVLKGTSLALSLAKYLGIIEDKLNIKLAELTGSELEAGLRSLKQAANSENESIHLLREARNRFNKAISLENELRLAAAYTGLALCHSFLNDKINAKIALNDLTKITILKPSNFVSTVGKTVTLEQTQKLLSIPLPLVTLAILASPISLIAGGTIAYCKSKWQTYEEKAKKLIKLQEEAKNILLTM